jgi:hypothetical protein
MTVDSLLATIERIKVLTAQARPDEAEHKIRLVDIANTMDDWDGTLMTLSDGWAIQTCTFAFNADRMREIDPDAYDSFLVAHPTKATAATVVITDSNGIEYTDEEETL